MEAFCTDCDVNVLLDKHGKCTRCGGGAILHVPVTEVEEVDEDEEEIFTPEDIERDSNEIMIKLADIGLKGLNPRQEAAIFLIVMRTCILRGLTLDLILSNFLAIWRLAMATTFGPDDSTRKPS